MLTNSSDVGVCESVCITWYYCQDGTVFYLPLLYINTGILKEPYLLREK